MAMSKCRECGKAVSTLAKTCPSCGVPKPTKILKKKNSTKKIIKKTENHKVEDWRDDPRFSGKRKKSSKKTEARNQWDELGWLDQDNYGSFEEYYKTIKGNKTSNKSIKSKTKEVVKRPKESSKKTEARNQWDELGWLDQDNHGSFEEYYKTIKVDKSIKSKTKEVKKEESTQDSDWRKSLGLDYENDDEESKKSNVQHEVKNSDYELNWDIGSLNPFTNPLFWIIGIFSSPFWYMDALKTYEDSSAALLEVAITILGWAIMLPIFILVIKFIAEVVDEFKIQKSKDEAVAKPEEITEVEFAATASNDNFIEDVFEGRKPLAETFWLYYVLANGLISFGAGYLADTNDNNIYLIAVLISNIWAGIGTWNSGTNYQLKKIKSGQPYGWAYGAKIMITLNFLTIAAQAILLFSL
jgi:ribosomal protein L37E